MVCSPWPPGAYVPPFFAHLPSSIYLLPGEVVRNIYLKLEKAFNFILVFFFNISIKCKLNKKLSKN